MSVKTFMCIRRMEEDGETEKPMHCRSVSVVDYDKATDRIAALEAALREAGQHVYGGRWIDHDADCTLGIDSEPCTCGLLDWLNRNRDVLGIRLGSSAETDGECKEHDFQRIAINNAASPSDPPELVYTPYRCVRCGMYQSQAKTKGDAP